MKKNNKKFLSLVLAVTMLLTSFAGLAVTSASAETPSETDPEYSTWDLAEATYTEDFDEANIAAFYAKGNWSGVSSRNGGDFSQDTGAFSFSDGYVNFIYQRELKYTNAPASGSFYYTYKIQGWNADSSNHPVKLTGTSEYTVATATSTAATYTTIVDTNAEKAYTYQHGSGNTKTLTDVTSFAGDTITGIKFENLSNDKDSNSYRIHKSFVYGTLVTPPDISTLRIKPVYTDDFSESFTLTEIAAGEESTGTYNENGWTQFRNNTTKFETSPSALAFQYNRWIEYRNSSTPASGLIAYRYNVKKETSAANVKIVGDSKEQIFSIPVSETGVEYTTVVDLDNKKAYNYTGNTLTSTSSFTTDNVKGIQFQNSTNDSFSFHLYGFTFGTLEEVPEAPALSTWTDGKTETTQYTTSFTDASGDGGNNDSTKEKLVTNSDSKWSLYRSDSPATEYGGGHVAIDTTKDDLALTYKGVAEYKNVPESGVFMYTYTIKVYEQAGKSFVKLLGPNEEIIASSDNFNIEGREYEFTTVIDEENGWAYTYNTKGDLANEGFPKVTDISGGAVTGIAFVADDIGTTSFRIADFKYIIVTDTPVQADDPTDLAIDYINEKINTTEALEYSTDNKETWTECTADMAATAFGWDGSAEKTVNFRTAASGTTQASAGDASVTIPARPAAPASTTYEVTQPTTLAGTGSIAEVGGTTNLEYRVGADGEWTNLPASDLAQGAEVYVRAKAVAEVKDGDTVTTAGKFASAATNAITISTITQETAPTLTIDYINETLGTFTADEKYTITASEADDLVKTDSAETIDITPYLGKTVSVVKNGTSGISVDSTAATIAVPSRPSAPVAQGNKPESDSAQGTITGVDDTMEYILKSTYDDNNSASWTAVPSEATSVSAAPETYYVRVKAKADANFVGEKATVTVPVYTATTYTIKGTVTAGVKSVTLDGDSDFTGTISGTEVTFENVLAGTYTVVVTAAEGYRNGTSAPAQITVSANDNNAFAATATQLAMVNVTTSTVPANVGSVTLTPNKNTATENDKITAQATTVAGYDTPVLEYSTDGGTTWTPVSGEITAGTADIAIRATYTASTYTIQKAQITNGTINVDGGAENASFGSTVSFTVSANTGYTVGTVTYTDAAGTAQTLTENEGKYTFTMPAANTTLNATFTQKNYTVTDNTASDANGSLTIDKTTNVHYGDSVKITIVPAENYELDTLMVDGSAVAAESIENNGYTFTMPNADVTVSATFKAVPVEPAKLLTYWTADEKTLNAAEGYPIDFGESNNNTADTALGSKWSLALVSGKIRIRNGSNSNIVLAIEGGENYNETLNEAANDGVFYYKYTIQSFSGGETGSHDVELAGTTGGTLFSCAADKVSGLRTYTTVVDSENNKAYTYDADGNLIGGAVEYAGTVTGISFINTQTAGAFWLDDIEYGTIGVKPIPKVTISAVDSTQGSVTVTVNSAPIVTNTEVAAGTGVTVTVAPQDGYEIDTFTVGGEDKKSSLNEGVYTFEMPDKDVAIAVTFKASATEPEPEGPAFSSWGITDYTASGDYREFYADHFKGYNGYIGNMARADKVTNPLPKAYWTVLAGKDSADVLLRDAIGSDDTGFMQVKHASNGTASGSVKYTNDVESNKFYYQYDLRIGKGEIEVKLDGITDNVIIAAADGDVAMATYTTVVDTESGKVYTYKGEELIKINEIGAGEVTGIIFSHVTSENADVADKGYADIDRFGHYYVEKTVDPDAKPKVKITAYDSEQGTVTVSAGGTSITSGSAEFDKNTEITVTVAAKDGYEISTFTVDGENKKSELNNGVYTFTIADADVTVAVTFKAVGSEPSDPKANISYWEDQTMTKADENTFANSGDEKTALNNKIKQELEGTDAIANWTFESKNSNGTTRADNSRVSADENGNLTVTYDGAAIYTRSAETGAYYYKYTISMSENGDGHDQTVSLTGIENGTLFTSPSKGGTFTTVISPSDKKAYTYDENGDLVSSNIITVADGEKVEGIEFRSSNNSNKNIKVSDFSYGLIGDAKEPEPPALEPTLADWAEKLGDAAYTFDFDKTLTDEEMFGEDGIWLTDGATGNQGDVWQREANDLTVLQVRNGRWAKLTKTLSGLYYYKFNLSVNGGNTIELDGTITDKTIREFTANKAYTEYTTVVDTENGKVYTYEGADTTAQPIKVNTIGGNETVTGIIFRSGTGYMYLDSLSYGLAKGETDPDPYTPGGGDEPEPSEEPVNVETKLSDWDLTEAAESEEFDGKSVSSLQTGGWKFGNTTGANFNEKHAQVNGSGELEVSWNGMATYAKTDEENSFYYTYTVKTKDKSGIRSIYLSGVDDSVMLVSGKQITSDAQTFTTVVDINSKKAYTYDNATGDFVSVVDVPDPANVKGIVFAANGESVALAVDNIAFGLVNVEAPERPVTIVLKSGNVNKGAALEDGKTYEVTGEKFTDTVIAFDAPYTVKDDKTLLFMTNTIDITSPNDNIVVDGTSITALEALSAGDYDITIAVRTAYKGEEYGSETYTVKFTKPTVSDADIADEYEPVITTETVDGREANVNTNENDEPTEIYNDLELPTDTSFASITWDSDHDDILSDSGEIVKRPLEDTTVVLTAAIANKYNSGSKVTKKVSVVVKGVGSMLDDAMTNALKIVSADSGEAVDLTDLHEDITIYTDYESDTYPEAGEVSIEWSSSDDVLKINGSTAEIYPTTTDSYNVKLTVKVSALGAEKTEDVDVTVHLTESNAAPKYAVRCDDLVEDNFADIADIAGTTVSSDIDVPTKGLFGSNISWTSSVPNYISNTGKYTAPSSNTSAKLTAVVSKGTVMSDKTHSYSFTVKGKNSTSSGGSSGGGGGSSSGKSSSYSMPISISTDQPANSGNYNPNAENQGGADTEPEGFTDLGTVEWAREAINALADKGIISGKSEHIFDPDANITRAEFATIIVKAFGFEDDSASVDEFADVSEGDWYYSFVAAAYNSGIISGYDNGTFGANDNITRQDMAVIIYRAVTASGSEPEAVNEGKTFDDEPSIADYAKEAVQSLVKAGVINGMTDTEFAPTANATRAQAAKMTYELVK